MKKPATKIDEISIQVVLASFQAVASYQPYPSAPGFQYILRLLVFTPLCAIASSTAEFSSFPGMRKKTPIRLV